MATERLASGPDIFVHVPKTAGTSLRKAIIDRYGANKVWVYTVHTDGLLRSDRQGYRNENPRHVAMQGLLTAVPSPLVRSAVQARRLLHTSPEACLRKAAAIIGHFGVDYFDGVTGSEELPKYTVVRDPLARMVSHYRYLQGFRELAPDLRGWMREDDPSLPFGEFALGGNVQNFQTRLTGTDPKRFDRIGVAESPGQFMANLRLIEPHEEAPRANQTTTPYPQDPVLRDPGFLRDFEAFHSADYAFYAAVLTQNSLDTVDHY